MAKVIVKVEAKKAFWFIPCVRIIALLAKCKVISLATARRWATHATNYAVKYRIDNGRWRKFDSPVIPFGGDV